MDKTIPDEGLLIKEFSDNRDRYIEQSKNTRNGVAAALPERKPIKYKKEKEREQS